MNKKRVLDIIKEELNFPNRERAEEFMEEVDIVTERIVKELEVIDKEKEESAKLGKYIKITKKHIKEKEGKVGKEKREYTKPAYDRVDIKKTAAIKKL